MAITIVHALWGDELVATWAKTMRDIHCGVHWRKQLPGTDRMVFAYGRQNARFLWCCGADPISADEQAVVDFDGVGIRPSRHDSRMGSVNYGLSHWLHKAHAICQAFERGATEVIWRDWDTVVRNETEAERILSSLKKGPVVQGRLRHYKRLQPPAQLSSVWHGGCYYVRDASIFQDVRDMRPDNVNVADEGLLKVLTDRLFRCGDANGSDEQYRDLGLDNPRLHDTRWNAVPSRPETVSLFCESRLCRTPAFARMPSEVVI